MADILDYSKIEAGVLDVERVEFPVAAVIDDVFDLMQPAGRSASPTSTSGSTAPELPTVIGDPGKLRQILLNLVGNAVKFTEQGTIWLVVETASRAPGDAWVLRIVVTDTGIGIDGRRGWRDLRALHPGRRHRSPAASAAAAWASPSVAASSTGWAAGSVSTAGSATAAASASPCRSSAGQGRSRPNRSEARGGFGDRPPRRLDILVVEDNDVNALVAKGLLERERATAPSPGRLGPRGVGQRRDP